MFVVLFFAWHFPSDLAGRYLNAFYFPINESNIDCDEWMRELVALAAMILPGEVAEYPILFAFDDFPVEKEEDLFEAEEYLSDHAARNGIPYLEIVGIALLHC